VEEGVAITAQPSLVVAMVALAVAVAVKRNLRRVLELPIKVMTVEQVKPQAEIAVVEAVEVLALWVLMALQPQSAVLVEQVSQALLIQFNAVEVEAVALNRVLVVWLALVVLEAAVLALLAHQQQAELQTQAVAVVVAQTALPQAPLAEQEALVLLFSNTPHHSPSQLVQA
jgi:hypothetical protein